MSRSEIEQLMYRPNYYRPRTKLKRPLNLKPPKCDDCSRYLHPDIDHSGCEKRRP